MGNDEWRMANGEWRARRGAEVFGGRRGIADCGLRIGERTGTHGFMIREGGGDEGGALLFGEFAAAHNKVG